MNQIKTSTPANDLSIFARNVTGSTEILGKATVGVAGCGGLGSNVAVALVRAGVGSLILVDSDVVEASNLNRQHYFIADIGRKKTHALADHLRAINPSLRLTIIDTRIAPKDVSTIFRDAAILIEAFDIAASKLWLIEEWRSSFPDRHVVCASGCAGIGKSETISVRHTGTIHVAGDFESDMSMGLCSARVAIVANMEANIAIELLVKQGA